MSAVRARLGPRRWHFQHGPIDLVIGADGDAPAIEEAVGDAWSRFEGVLAELVAELPRLRAPVNGHCALEGAIARRMWSACAFYGDEFITPMAAVAGSVAQEMVAFFDRPGIERAWVNNGGDIALHLAPGASARVAICSNPDSRDPHRPMLADRVVVDASSPVRGIATSGWRGRSHSLGIADAVTVLAPSASQADAAATMIANAVDCDDAAIDRRPACQLKDDSDLGRRLVTVAVAPMSQHSAELALGHGERYARELLARGIVAQAMLSLQGRSRIVVSQ